MLTDSTSTTTTLSTRFIIASIAVHIGAVLVFGYFSMTTDSRPTPPPAIKTRLVKLGKKRDPKLLPRSVQQPAAKPVEAVPAPTPASAAPVSKKTENKSAKPEPKKKKQSATDILNQKLEAATPSASELLAEKMEAEGSEDGSEMGTELSGRLKASYNDKILSQMQRNLVVPNSLTDQERTALSAHVALGISSSGSLQFVKLRKSSGHEGFDNAVLATIRASAPFPEPASSLQSFYAQGVVVELCPVRCR